MRSSRGRLDSPRSQFKIPIRVSPCNNKDMNVSFEGFKEAWNNNGKYVYPRKPADARERWFLRTPINEEKEKDLVFIGVNPSDATALRFDKKDGDGTTRVLLSYFRLDDKDRPLHYRRITIVNLIPLVAGNRRDLPDWHEEGGRRKILESVAVTFTVLPTVLGTADIVLPMWGDPEASKFPWKKSILPIVKPLIRECRSVRPFQVQGYIQQAKRFPYHCAYSKDISRWKSDVWVDDASFVLED